MAHFAKPLSALAVGYEVDNRLAPGSIWRVQIPLGETRDVALCCAAGLWVRSNNPAVVPNNGFKERQKGSDRILTLFGRSLGTSMVETGKGDSVWVALQIRVTGPNLTHATVFHPGVNHGHSPSGRWSEVQANPNSSWDLNRLCPRMSPKLLVNTAIIAEFRDKPLALEHLNWYLSIGKGRDFQENDNIKAMLEKDQGVQLAIARHLLHSQKTGIFNSHFMLEQTDYENQDFRFAFGGIDQLDFEVDFDRGTIHVWFQDRYEWHPVYPKLYKKFPDDEVRPTNCLHAALVELKSSGAADFWMKGEAKVPLSLITNGSHSTSDKKL